MSIKIIGTEIEALALKPTITGRENIPTGGEGLYRITTEQIKDYILNYFAKQSINLGNVDNTSDEDKPLSKAIRDALANVLNKNSDNIVTSVNSLTGDLLLNASSFGLGNVDNTKDIDKPLSTADMSALFLKMDKSIFNEFEDLFVRFQDRVEVWLANLDELAYRTHLLSLSNEERIFQLEKDLEDLRDYVDSEIHRIHHSLSNTQVDLILKLVSDNFDTNLYHSLYLESVIQALQSYTDNSIALVNLELYDLRRADAVLDLQIRTLEQNTSQALTDLRNSFSDLQVSVDQQYVGLQNLIEEAKDYIDDQIASIPNIINQFKEETSLLLNSLKDEVSGITNNLDHKLDGVSNSIDDKINANNAFYIAPIYETAKKDLENAINSLDREFALSIDTVYQTVADAKKAAQDAILDAENLAAIKDAEIKGLIESQISHSLLIINEVKQTLEDTKNQLNAESDAIKAQITQERIDRDNAIKTAVDAAMADIENQLANIDLPAIQELSNKIDILNAKIEDGSAFLSQDVIDHINAELDRLDGKLQTDLQNLGGSITIEQIDRLGRIAILEDGISQEIINRKDGDDALLSNIENYKVSNNQALANIQTGIEVLVDETLASSSKWTEIDTKFEGVNTSISSVTDRVDTLNTENVAQAAQLETMSTTISNNDSTVKGLIATETSSRTTADSNMNSRIDTIQSEFTTDLSTTKAAINSLEETTVSADEALSLRINQNKTSIEGVDSKVDSEITTVNQTITTLEGSVATQLEKITSDYKAADAVVNAAVLSESTARVEANQALAERIEAIRSSFTSGINIAPFIYTDPVEPLLLPTTNGKVVPISVPDEDLSSFFYTKYYWNLSPVDNDLSTIQFRANSYDYNIQLTGETKHIVSVYLKHNLAVNKVVTLSLNDNNGFTIENQVTVTPSSNFIRYFVVLDSPVTSSLAYFSIKFTGSTTDILSISRIMVEQRDGEPSVWTSGAIGSTSSYVDKINTLNNDQVALGERFESLSTEFTTNDTNLRSLVATESESRSTADEALGRRVDSVQSSFDNTVFGGQNFWEFKNTGNTDQGTKTVVLVNDNLQHQRITINSIGTNSFSNLWSNVRVTGTPDLDIDVPSSISFDILSPFSKIRVFGYAWGISNNVTNELIEVIPNQWNRVRLENISSKVGASANYTGLIGVRFFLNDNNIVEADLVGSVFEIKNIQLQQGTKATGYVPPFITLQNELVKANAAITTESTTRASQNLATATRIDGVTAEIVNSENRANAKILTEETARVEGDRVLTTRIQNLESTTDQLSIGASNLIPFSYNFKTGTSNNANITAIAGTDLKLKIITTDAQSSATTLSNFLSVDSTTTYALTNISNTGIVTVVMSFWVKRENPSLAFVAHPEMRLNTTTGFVLPFFVRGSPTQANAYQLSYKFTSTTEAGFTTIAPSIRIKGPELASPLIIDRWKLELGTIATDWSDFKEGIVEIDKRTQASISNIQKTVTDNNTALTDEINKNTSLISDLPNQGINLLPYETTVPKDILWYKVTDSVGLVYNSTISTFKGINITTNAAALSTVTLNSNTTPFNVDLEVARYLFSVEALSTTDKHPLSVDLLPVRGTSGAIIKGASVELTTTLKQHTFLFSVPVRGKYDIVLNVNNALVTNRLIRITKPMLEQQIGTNLKASAFKEGLVDSEFSLLPITYSESNIISQLKTTAADGVATASKVDSLTADVAAEGLKVQGQITSINQSITDAEGNTTTQINQLGSKFEKDLLRSSDNLIVLKNITTTNNGTVVLGADRTTFIFGKVSATSHFNIPVDFSTLQVGTRLTYSFNARSNYVLKDILLTASANLKVVRVLVGDTEQTTVTNSQITFNSSLAVNKYHSITILFEVILANSGTIQLGTSFNGTDQTFNVDIQYPMLSTGGKGVGWRLSNADSEIYKIYTDAQITQYSQTVANQFQAVAETQTSMQTTIETNRNKAATDIATVTKSISDNDQAYAQQFTTLNARFTTYKGNGNNLLNYETSVGEKLAMFNGSVGLEIASTEVVTDNYSKITFKASATRASFTLRVNLDENYSALAEILFSIYLSNLVPIKVTLSNNITTLFNASADNRLVGIPTNTYIDLTIVTPTGDNITLGTNIFSISRLMVEQSSVGIPSVWVAGSKGLGTVIESNSLELKESIANAESTLNRRIDSMESNFNGRVTGGGNLWTITDNLVNTNTITGNLTALIVDNTIDYLTIKSNVAQTNAAYKIANTSVVPNIQVVPNTTYSLSFKVRSTVATTMEIEVINGTSTSFKPTIVNLTTNTQLLTFSIKFTGTSTTETSIKFLFPSLVLNSIIHISELMFQEGPGTQYTKAVPYLERSIVATKANIEDHKVTYASDKESTATRLNQMSTEYRSSGGSVLVDNTTSNPTSWWSGEKPDLKDNFVTSTNAPSGFSVFTKTDSVADRVLDNIYNLTTVPSSQAYTISVYIKRDTGSLGKCYITTGTRLTSSPTSNIIRSQNIDITSQVPADGTWVNVKVTMPASAANSPQKYFGFRLNVEAATAGAASYLQSYTVTPVVTSANIDGSVATKANIEDLSLVVSNANTASTERTTKLESDMAAVDGKINNKIATALTTYYTRTETDSAVAGQLSKFEASLALGGGILDVGRSKVIKTFEFGSGTINVTDRKANSFKIDVTNQGLMSAYLSLATNSENLPIGASYVFTGKVRASRAGAVDLIYSRINQFTSESYIYGEVGTEWQTFTAKGVTNTTDGNELYSIIGAKMPAAIAGDWVEFKDCRVSVNSDSITAANAQAIQNTNTEVVRVDGKTTVNANNISSLNSRLGTVEGAVSTKAEASALQDYYTKAEATDNATTVAAGEIAKYDANLVIGGANLLKNSNFEGELGSSNWSNYGGSWVKQQDSVHGTVLRCEYGALTHEWVTVDVGATLVFSALVRTPVDRGMHLHAPLHWWAGKDYANESKFEALKKSHDVMPAGVWTKIWVVIKLTGDANSFKPFIYDTVPLDGFEIAWTKLEKGNKVTDWTPNDQEVQQSINANANAIQTVNVEVARVNGEVVSTANSVSTLSSNVGLLQGSINEVRQTVTNNQESTNILVTSLKSGMADADDVSMMMRNATVLFEDLNFSIWTNGAVLYNNHGNGALVSNFTDKLPDNPVASTRQIEFIHSGGATTPGLGGFHQMVQSRANGVFLMKFVAKLPVGFSFDAVANAYGDGANAYFIGGNEGTGKFKTYYAVYRCGATGSFSTVGFIYANGPAATPENPLIWYLASSTVYDCLDSKVAPDSVVNGIAEAKSTASTAVNKAEATAQIAQDIRADLDNTNATISTQYYTKADTLSAITSASNQLSSSFDTSIKNVGVIKDTRYDNQPPSWYWANHPHRTEKEFKNSYYIGIPHATVDTLGVLETVVPWIDVSGGAIQQKFTWTDSAYALTRYSISQNEWSGWASALNDVKNTVNSKLDASIISDYYTKAEADNVVAGKVEQFSSTIAVGGANLWSVVNATRVSEQGSHSVSARREDEEEVWITVDSLSGDISLIRFDSCLVDKNTPFIEGEDVVLSFEVSSSGYNRLGTVYAYVGNVGSAAFYANLVLDPRKWTRIVHKFKATGVALDGASQLLGFYLHSADGWNVGTTLSIRHVQLQRGNTATAFSKSPAITRATIKETTKSINGIEAVKTVTIDNNGVMSGYGLISELKNGQVTSTFGVNANNFYIGSPASGKKPFMVTSGHTDANGVTYPAGTWMDVALIANATIGNAKIANLDAGKITTGTLDAGRIRVGSSTQFDNGYAPTDVLNGAKSYADAIEVGSRNLLKDSALIQFRGSDNGNEWASVVVGDFVRLTPVAAGNVWGNTAANGGLVPASELLAGEQYTYSVMVKTAMTSIGLYCYSGGNHLKGNIPLKSENVWERVSFTFTQSTARAKNYTFLAGFHQLQTGVVVEYRNFKLEKGNKATDWTPAPEDVDTAISNAASTAATAKGAADAANNQVNTWKFTGTTEIDGGKIRADSIAAGKLDVNELSTITASLGTMISYENPSNVYGARTIIKGDVIEVYDNSNRLRVRLGRW